MLYQKFDTDISKISIFPPAIRYDISTSNRYFRYIEAAVELRLWRWWCALRCRQSLRRCIEQLILATDITRHQEFVATLKVRLISTYYLYPAKLQTVLVVVVVFNKFVAASFFLNSMFLYNTTKCCEVVAQKCHAILTPFAISPPNRNIVQFSWKVYTATLNCLSLNHEHLTQLSMHKHFRR